MAKYAATSTTMPIAKMRKLAISWLRKPAPPPRSMEAATEAPAHAAKKPLLMPVQFDSLEKVRMPATAVHSSASIGMSACEHSTDSGRVRDGERMGS